MFHHMNTSVGRLAGYLGFSKTYNFLLYFVFAGALLGFSLARLQYLDYYGIFCGGGSNGAAPGEFYYYTQGHYRIGMMLHLFTILPAGLLAIFQFVPIIRHKVILFHRLNGYIVITLVVISIVGALMVARHSFGGSLDIQSAVGFLAVIVIVSLTLSYINIKKLRIDRHRVWMLRAWFYLGSIITTRIIMIIAAMIITSDDGYYATRSCEQLQFTFEKVDKLYPECEAYVNGSNPNQQAIVHADMNGKPAEIGVALGISFGMGLWLAIAIHAIGVEIYLQCTPVERERLREVSKTRRVEAGLETLQIRIPSPSGVREPEKVLVSRSIRKSSDSTV